MATRVPYARLWAVGFLGLQFITADTTYKSLEESAEMFKDYKGTIKIVTPQPKNTGEWVISWLTTPGREAAKAWYNNAHPPEPGQPS